MFDLLKLRPKFYNNFNDPNISSKDKKNCEVNGTLAKFN